MFAELAFPTTFDRLFHGLSQELARSVDHDRNVPLSVWSNDQAIVITAEVPGLKPEQIHLDLAGDVLSISAEPSPTAASDEGRWLLAERSTKRLRRAVQLPCRVDADGIQARIADGVLTVVCPRAASDRPRSIAITAAN
jgi:HSP20 family protein